MIFSVEGMPTSMCLLHDANTKDGERTYKQPILTHVKSVNPTEFCRNDFGFCWWRQGHIIAQVGPKLASDLSQKALQVNGYV